MRQLNGKKKIVTIACTHRANSSRAMRHGTPDRYFYTENDVRFLRQFSTRINA